MMKRRKAQKVILTVLPLLLIGGLIVLGIPGCRPRVIIVTATPAPQEMAPQKPSEEMPPQEAPERQPQEVPPQEAPPEGKPPGEVRISFTADRTTLNPGECATLQWNVEGGFEVLLGRMGEPGDKVGRSGQTQVCPDGTTTYWLGVDTGEKVEHRQIQIVVAGAAPPQPPPTQPPAPQPPAPTPTPQPPAPSVVINFRADDTSITAGQCTILRWDVDYAKEVYLDGAGVVGHGSKKVCPGSTTTYTLHVVHTAGVTDKQVTIHVAGAPPAKPNPTPTPTPTPTPALPDLTVTDITLVGGDRIQCSWQNIGGDVLPKGSDIWISIYINGVDAGPDNVGVRNFVYAGYQGWLQTRPLKLPSFMVVRCVIDSQNDVFEANESNNELVKTFGHLPSTDLEITDIYADQNWNLYVKIKNNGPDDLTNTDVDLSCHGTVHLAGGGGSTFGGGGTITVNLAVGQEAPFQAGFLKDVGWYTLECNITGQNFFDPNSTNDTFTKNITRGP